MATISALVSASARLHNSAGLSDEDYDRQIRDLVTYFKHSLSTKALDSVARDDALLDNFDPAKDSIAYLFLLRLQIQALQEASRETLPADLLPPGKLWLMAVRYLELFDCAQVRYAGQEWRQLVEFVGQAAQAASHPLLAIRPIRQAMLRLDPSCAVFTSTHLLFVRLCLHARAYAFALPVLDRHICHFPALSGRGPSEFSSVLCARHESSLSFITDSSGLSSKLSYKDYLRYFLYGGMVYMALREWRKAGHFLGIVIAMPTVGSISMIMVEAYKKWLLVGLLEKGKLCSPPGITAPHVVKLYQSLAKPYVNLAQSFERGDMNKFGAEIDAAREIWLMDCNMGLISQVSNAFAKHTVIRLRKTFAALTVAEILEQASSLPADHRAAESTIASFIMSNVVGATLVHPPNHVGDTMLRFSAIPSLPRLSHETHMQAHFKREGGLLGALMGSLEQSNRTLGLSDESVDSLQKGQVRAGASERDQGLGEEDIGLEMDEDIMGDFS